ncbi:hypothetical protein KUTeg_009340 [Tegillarca granosa]|uniref:Uncharacterized protein n=1 Tax=Tegillarca granosa TaxID=220873 RepID=A0ABQ9F7Y1_TEGGR|nr:hypothetical protein KUTeg_009340 [Tegillarca granosa]
MYKRHRHPVPRPKQRPNPRIQLNILKLDEDGNSIYDDDLDEHVCHCCPSTSSRYIPSMVYDHLKCPHVNSNHVLQPGQQQVFAYPWTANTNIGKSHPQQNSEPYQERSHLSAIQEGEEDVVIPSSRQPTAVKTAPPFANTFQQETFRGKPPFTAPVDSEWPMHVRPFSKSQSVPSLTGYMSPRSKIPKSRDVQSQGSIDQLFTDTEDEFLEPSSPYISYQRNITRDRVPTQRTPRNFEGTYVDAKTNQVYNFKVKYGKKNVEAVRTPNQSPHVATPAFRQK